MLAGKNWKLPADAFVTPTRMSPSFHTIVVSRARRTRVVAPYDVVIDGSANFPTRYLSNDVCVFARNRNIYGSVFRLKARPVSSRPIWAVRATAASFRSRRHRSRAQLRRSRRTRRIAGIIGLVQATEALKLIVGEGEPLVGG